MRDTVADQYLQHKKRIDNGPNPNGYSEYDAERDTLNDFYDWVEPILISQVRNAVSADNGIDKRSNPSAIF
jgi:hypothetical protein